MAEQKTVFSARSKSSTGKAGKSGPSRPPGLFSFIGAVPRTEWLPPESDKACSRPSSGSAIGTRRFSAIGSPRHSPNPTRLRSTMRSATCSRRSPADPKKSRRSRVWFWRRFVTRGKHDRKHGRSRPCPRTGVRAAVPSFPPTHSAAAARAACCCGASKAIRPAWTEARTTRRWTSPPGRVRCSRRSAPRSAMSPACCFATRAAALAGQRRPRRYPRHPVPGQTSRGRAEGMAVALGGRRGPAQASPGTAILNGRVRFGIALPGTDRPLSRPLKK